MMEKRVLAGLLGVWLSSVLCLAQPGANGERQQFDQTRIRAEKGEAQAQMDLSLMYSSGTGVNRDLSKATRWCRKAAEQGLAHAQYVLGLDYMQGIGVKPDFEEGVRWLHKAADQGVLDAQVQLGLAYAEGHGIEPNQVEAARWYRKAADQGSAYAEYELGTCYFEGTGVTKDISEGLKWTRLSAEQGFPQAQNQLGECYERGTGVEQNYMEAYKWFNLAAAQDDEHAADIRVSLAKVESFLSKEQVAEAQRMAREFKPGQKTDPAAATPDPKPAGAELGTVDLVAGEDACEIFVDGKFAGNSPAKLKLSQGPHVIEVKKGGFRSYRRELEVGAGSELTLRVALEQGQ